MGTKLEHPQSGCEKSLEIMNDVYMQVHQPLNIAYVNSAYLQVPINNFKVTKIGRLTHARSARLSQSNHQVSWPSMLLAVLTILRS